MGLPDTSARSGQIGARLGRAVYYRGKGDLYLSALRQWITPVMLGSAVTKYLGFLSAWEAVALWAGIAVASEAASLTLGWLERRIGATQANFGLAAETDPYKARSLVLLEEIREAIVSLRDDHLNDGGMPKPPALLYGGRGLDPRSGTETGGVAPTSSRRCYESGGD